ncbi:MAG TPA: serine/threonine-protein kinase, partial [Gemmatales bacterium]|nr:serine/threonine-protein kinase [Gemmatales bacterium]
LKMILAGPFAAPAAAQRFRIEAEAAAGLDHPHIVPIYEIGTCEGKTYFTMKLVEGETLAARLRALTVEQRTGETLRSLIRILLQVVQAVDFAHQRGVIHRDLKPANILLEGDSQTPYVADFGLAKRTPIGLGETATAEDLTATGAILGTPNYMAPEQASGTGTTTTQTDVYALGAILYEILTGRPPLVGGSPVATLLKVQQEDPLPPSQVRPGVDTGLAAVALRCLHKEPGERYPNATALAADLRAWLAGEPLSVRPPRLVQIVRHWLNHHLRDAFWIGIVGVLGGGLGVSLSTFAWIGGLFRSAQTVLDRFPSVEAPTWLRLLAMPAELDAASAVWPQMLGAIVLSCLGLFLGWFVDLTHVQRALRHGLGLGLITGLVVALAVVPVFVLYGVVGIDLKLEFELVEGYFERFGNDAENKQVPLKRLDLFTVHPELREFQGKEAANQYFALRNVVKVVRIFEGAWAALLLAIVVFPFLCVGQCLLAGLVFRRCDGKLRRALLYAIVVLPCAHLLIYGAYFVMSGIYGGGGKWPGRWATASLSARVRTPMPLQCWSGRSHDPDHPSAGCAHADARSACPLDQCRSVH